MSNPEYTYGYASIRTGHTKEELKANFKNTKLYSDYVDIVNFLKSIFFYVPSEEEIPDSQLIENNIGFESDKVLQIDVMTSKRDGMHHKLDAIIEQSIRRHKEKREELPEVFRDKYKKQVNTVIVVNSISAFGNCEDTKKYYKIFREEKIGVLIPDYTRECGLSEYSTADFSFQLRPLAEYNRAFDLVEGLEQGDIPDNRGRIGGEYTNAFRVAFWLYELFKIPEKIAVSMSGYSKNGFHMKADNYEQTLSYKKELELLEEKFGISKLIKRNRPVPENMDKLMHRVEKSKAKKVGIDEYTSLELACIHCKIPMIFPIDYSRLILKHNGGKKELARCLKLYDEELIKQFEEWIMAGNLPTDFYRQCNIEQFLYNAPTRGA